MSVDREKNKENVLEYSQRRSLNSSASDKLLKRPEHHGSADEILGGERESSDLSLGLFKE